MAAAAFAGTVGAGEVQLKLHIPVRFMGSFLPRFLSPPQISES